MGYPASTGEGLESLREEVDKLEKCFLVEEDQEGVCGSVGV